MTETKFTKGEWKIRDGYEVGISVTFGSGFFTVASCQLFNEAKANAHLIAAAPEMYDFIGTYMGGHPEAELLLAKARGEQ